MELIEHLRTWDELPDDDGEAFHWLDLKTGEAADLIEKQAAELAAAKAEIELERTARQQTERLLHQQAETIAAEQAKNMGLWEALENLVKASAVCLCHFETDHTAATEALSAIALGTSALESYVTKAGEKMQEKTAQMLLNGHFLHDQAPGAILAREAAKAIRALPGVTLEDLK